VVRLDQYDNKSYDCGRGILAQSLWFFIGLPILRCQINPFSGLKSSLLRLFGATIGVGVIIKPGVRVKYPWKLSVGDHSWIGEDVWIDNLAQVTIGSHACLSQAAYLCTGNHDWKDPKFRLMISEIQIGEGAWVGAKSVLCPGVTMAKLSILTAGSVATGCIPGNEILAGNPAIFVRTRIIQSA